ncbi:MAG: hypothetical protein WCO79_02430 [bacterium]
MFGFTHFFSKEGEPTLAKNEQGDVVPMTREALLVDAKRASEYFAEPYTDEKKGQFFASGPKWLVEMATQVPFGNQFFIKDIVQAIIFVAETSQATRPEEINETSVQKRLFALLKDKAIGTINGDDDKISARMGVSTFFDEPASDGAEPGQKS